MSKDEIRTAVLCLPEKDREWLAEELWFSIHNPSAVLSGLPKDEIRNDALALPEKDRQWLSGEIWFSINHMTEEEVEKAWIEEIARRAKNIENGTAILHDGPTVMKKLREKYGR